MERTTKPDLPMIVREARVGGFVRVNRMFADRLGYHAEELRERPLLEWIHPDDRDAFQGVLDAGQGVVEARHSASPDGWARIAWRVRSEADGPVALGLLRSAASQPVKPSGTASAPEPDTMAATLHAMALIIEDQHPGLKCSVLLVTKDGRCVSVGAGPSLPPEYNAAVEGLMIGPAVGSCGTAAYWNVRVIVEDIQADPLWKDLREEAAKAGVAACWSHPITSQSGVVLGALALYDAVPGAPTQHQLDGLESAARMVSLAIERGRAEQALRASEAQAKFHSRLLSAVTTIVTTFLDTGDWRTASSRLVRAALELTGSHCGFLGVVHGDERRVSAPEGVVRSEDARNFDEEELETFDEEHCPDLSEFEALFDHVITSGQAVISNDVRIDRSATSPADHPEVPNVLGAPIKYGGDVVAMIVVGNVDRGYDARDLRTAEVLCRAGSVLLDSYRRQQHESALEAQLRQAAKMEALGVLAGGIAHDFNNMLMTVLGNAELALAQLPDESHVRRLLAEIITATDRATELCNQMLAYAGRGIQSTQRLECNKLVRDLGALLQVALSKKAILKYELFDEPLFVEADKTQLRQVIMNLITNAAEALGNDEGQILVTTSAQVYDEDELERFRPSRPLEAGEYLRLTVADTGCGMTEETRARIFDPFFTTKFKGRGLGLAAVQGIVRGHGGVISLESEVGEGTTFTVLLPRMEAPVEEPRAQDRVFDAHDGRRVLVVDDEPEVRSIVCGILRHEGFEVLQAADGQEAIEVFRREGDRIDCVLLDLSMPKLDGEETFLALREIRDDVRVVLTSGFTEREVLARFEGAGLAGVLQKPTPRRVLLAKLHEAMS